MVTKERLEALLAQVNRDLTSPVPTVQTAADGRVSISRNAYNVADTLMETRRLLEELLALNN